PNFYPAPSILLENDYFDAPTPQNQVVVVNAADYLCVDAHRLIAREFSRPKPALSRQKSPFFRDVEMRIERRAAPARISYFSPINVRFPGSLHFPESILDDRPIDRIDCSARSSREVSGGRPHVAYLV